MAFSKRIKKLASLVDSDAYVIDVGCDHGLLDIYLTLRNNNKCVACDIKESALNNAIENIKKYNLNIDVKQSDGLNNIDVPPHSTCVIAGMGTSMILHILNNNKIANLDNLIIQTNNDYEELRKEVLKLGFYIVDEVVIQDKKIWYVIIKFKKGYRKYNKIEYIFGPILLKKIDADTFSYFNYELHKYKNILNSIPNKYLFKRLKIKYILSKLNNYIKNVGPSL